jgi:hypothetical protein
VVLAPDGSAWRYRPRDGQCDDGPAPATLGSFGVSTALGTVAATVDLVTVGEGSTGMVSGNDEACDGRR